MDISKSESLSKFLLDKTQAEVAQIIGVTQGAVSQMVRSGRDIWIRVNADGSHEAVEITSVGRRSNSKAA